MTEETQCDCSKAELWYAGERDLLNQVETFPASFPVDLVCKKLAGKGSNHDHMIWQPLVCQVPRLQSHVLWNARIERTLRLIITTILFNAVLVT